MKTLLRLLVLLLLASSCSFFNKKKDTTAGDSAIAFDANNKDSSDIPTEYSIVDSTSIIDSVELVEAPPVPTEPLDFMTIEEWEMINEINLLRGDPQAYLRFVDEYMEHFVKDPNLSTVDKQKEMEAANELRHEMKSMEPRNALHPFYKLHQVAVMHGDDMIKMEQINHLGSDGSHPYQRIQDNTELDGTEILVAGHSTIRESLISLLIDGGISNRGHRRNLLDNRWQYLACYQVGTVAEINNVWVQLFAFDDPKEDEVPPIRSIPVEKTNEESKLEEPAKSSENTFLTTEEQSMVEEINLMRSNPAAYIQHVDEYAKYYRQSGFGEDPQFESAVKELKEQLTNMGALSQLKVHEKLYAVAKAHGLDNKNNNQLEHKGSDGSDSFGRVKRSGLKNHIDGKGYFSPNENLVGGETTARKAVLALLIDAGISTRGHRKALMDPNWEYVACYKIGLIENLPELKGNENDDMDHCWIQLFAKD